MNILIIIYSNLLKQNYLFNITLILRLFCSNGSKNFKSIIVGTLLVDVSHETTTS